MLLAERSSMQEELPRSEAQNLAQKLSYTALHNAGKQQLAPPEIQCVPTRVEVNPQQRRETYLGGALLGVRLSESSQQSPQHYMGASAHVTLGQLTSESGPVFEIVSVKQLLGQGRVVAARELLQRALSRYPTDERLRNLFRAVIPGEVVRRDVRYSDRTLEMAWIKANRANYRGKWVALLGEKVLGVGDSLKRVLRLLQEQQCEATPLIHHFD